MIAASDPKPSTAALIAKLERFAPLTPDDCARLHRVGTGVRHVGPGTDLIRQGEPPDGMLVILDGFACRYKLRRKGVRQITAYLLPGDAGDPDEALLTRTDHAIGTLSPCTIVRIPSPVVEELLRSPSLSRALRLNTMVDRSTAWEWLVNLGRRSAQERLAHLFCELLLRLEAVGRVSDGGYSLPVTQLDLADTTGLTPVHINRTLGDLRARGLITLRSRRLTVRDLPRLWALAEFDPRYLHLDERTAVWAMVQRASAPPALHLGQAYHVL